MAGSCPPPDPNGWRVLPAAAAEGPLWLVALCAGLTLSGRSAPQWVSAPELPPGVWPVLLIGLLAPLLLPAQRLGRSRPWRSGVLLCAAALLWRLGHDSWQYWRLLHSGALHGGLAVPLSLLLAVLVARAAWRRLSSRSVRGMPLRWWLPGAAAGALLGLAAFILTFGTTDYRRPADCAIIMGAAVYPDGTPTPALRHRILMGVALYREGWVECLIMSGGVDFRGTSEPAVMRAVAMAEGVPAEAILVDEAGVNTRASALSCKRLMAEHGLHSALIVSHFYHLARCRSAFSRAGVSCATVPVAASWTWDDARMLARDVVAYIAYAR